MKTLKELAQEALDVQNAVNLTAVVSAWAVAAVYLGPALRKHTGHGWGTDELNQHAINVLWADKVAHLTGTQTLDHPTVSDAYQVVMKLAKGE